MIARRNTSVRSRVATALFAAAVAAVATTPAVEAGAQLAYDSTTFLHGIGSSDLIWKAGYSTLGYRTPPEYLSATVYLKGVGTPYLNEGATDGPKTRTAGLRYADQRNNLVQFLTGAGGRHVLVAHSLGSLVARGTFDVVGAQRIAGIITIAAPHQGTIIAAPDTAATAVRFTTDLRRRLTDAERNISIYLGVMFGIGATAFAIDDAVTAYKLSQSGGLPSGEVEALPLLSALQDLGPQADAVQQLNAYRGDGAIPRANIRGSIPYAHAILRLAAASGPSSFEELKSRKDKALSLMRKCKNLGNWTFNLSDPGNRCQHAANMLNALDAKWAGWVNGTVCDGALPGGGCLRQVPRKIPFDGVVPNERSNYPTSTGLVADVIVPGASHQDIYKGRDALDAAAAAMISMGMERPNGLTASLTGPSTYTSSQTLTWRVAATGGSSAYTYEWSYLPSESSTWLAFGNGAASAARSVTSTTPSFTVRVRVVSGGQVSVQNLSVRNASNGGCVQQPGGPPCPL